MKREYFSGTKRATSAKHSAVRLFGLNREMTFQALKCIIERNTHLTPDEKKVLKLKYGVDGLTLSEREMSDRLRIEYSKVLGLLESATKKIIRNP